MLGDLGLGDGRCASAKADKADRVLGHGFSRVDVRDVRQRTGQKSESCQQWEPHGHARHAVKNTISEARERSVSDFLAAVSDWDQQVHGKFDKSSFPNLRARAHACEHIASE